MQRSQQVTEDYFVRIEQAQKLYHKKEYYAALQRASSLLSVLRSETQLQAKDHARLLLEITSLRGLFNSMMLQYEAAAADFEECMGLDRYHVTTCFRRISLFFKQKRLKEALNEMKVAFRLSPETKYRGYEIQIFQQLLEEETGEFKAQLKLELDNFLREEDLPPDEKEEEEEEDEVAFMYLKNIEKKPQKSKSKRKLVDFGEDKQVQIKKEANQKVVIPLPKIDHASLKSQNQELKEYILELEASSPPETPSAFRISNVKNPRSILKQSSVYGAPPSSISHTVPDCQLLNFSVERVKDIDGKKIESSKHTKVGASMMVTDKDMKKQYVPGQAPTRSMMKLNGSFCANKMSVLKGVQLQAPSGDDEKTQKGFGRLKDIDGKKKGRTEEDRVKATVVNEEGPRHEYNPASAESGGSMMKRSIMKDPTKSMLKKAKGLQATGVRQSIVCFKD